MILCVCVLVSGKINSEISSMKGLLLVYRHLYAAILVSSREYAVKSPWDFFLD